MIKILIPFYPQSSHVEVLLSSSIQIIAFAPHTVHLGAISSVVVKACTAPLRYNAITSAECVKEIDFD